MDENYVREKFECIDKKLTQVCTNQTLMQKTANTWIKVISIFMPVVILLCSYIITQQFTRDNNSDFLHQQEINSLNDRLIKLEVLSGTTTKQR